MKRLLILVAAGLLLLGKTVANAETVTALAIADTYWCDRPDTAISSYGARQKFYAAQNIGDDRECIGPVKFELDKFQDYSSSDVSQATLRVELQYHRNDPDMGWDIVAMKSDWDEITSTWNAQQQDCSLIFGTILSCSEDEIVDWLPDNGNDDVVTTVVGKEIYASLDDDMSDYFEAVGEPVGSNPQIKSVGIIKEWDVTDLVKAWVGGTENLENGLAIRNELDARGDDGTERRWMVTQFWTKDATFDPLLNEPRTEPDGVVVANDDPWPPIVPQIVIELGEAGASRLAGDANQDGVVSADDYASVQSNFGNTNGPGLAGDANDDGVVSADDYASVQSNFGNTAGLQAAVSAAAAAQAPTVHFSFDEMAAGSWAVSVEVTGDTAGLSAYSIWTRGVDTSQVSYEEGTLGTIGDGFAPRGFQSSTFVSGDVGGDFNAGNFQGNGNAAIAGIGTDAVDDAGVIPGTTPHVQLGVPALLGTLTTPDGLGAANFEATSVGLLNVAGDGFLSDPPTPTSEVNLIPEPASLSLVGLSAILFLRRRSRLSSYLV